MLDELTKQNANSTRFAIFLEHENPVSIAQNVHWYGFIYSK